MPATLYLCRHGDTPWSTERRFAGKTDLPLTADGEEAARLLGKRLRTFPSQFDLVLTSPLLRARRTAEAAGYPARIDDRLMELGFGDYEGRTRDEILRERPGWTYIRDGNPNGESVAHVGARIDALLPDLRGNVLIFAHAVVLRVLTARWLGQPPRFAEHLSLAPASLSILHHDPVDDAQAIALWNDRSHLPHAPSFA
jgi:broad specificity phosphatase PhoE